MVSTLSTLIAGYSGLVVLLLTCLPLNALRAGLVAIMAALFAGAVVLLPQVFYLSPRFGRAMVGACVGGRAGACDSDRPGRAGAPLPPHGGPGEQRGGGIRISFSAASLWVPRLIL